MATLRAHFAPVLLNDQTLAITYDGATLDPSQEILHDTPVDVSFGADDAQTATVRIIEWRSGKHRAVYFGPDSDHFPYETAGDSIEKQFSFSAYVTWSGLGHDELGLLGLQEMAPDDVGELWRAVRHIVQEHFNARRYFNVRGPCDAFPMTELAYMVREDWAQHGTAMQESSDTIHAWLSGSKPVYAVGKPEKFDDKMRSADRETAVYISRSTSPRPVIGFSRLESVAARDDAAELSVVALHPYEERDCETLREVVDEGRVGKVYVHVWAPSDMVRHWLDGLGAINLHTGAAVAAPDPLQVEACTLMVNEEYNGLSTGRGKGAVIQLLWAFAAEGYALDANEWLRAYFRAGGSFRHAETVKKLAREMRDGKRHRVSQWFRPEIVSILREHVETRHFQP